MSAVIFDHVEKTYRGKRGDLIKLIWHDGQGLCLFAKRLERGRFIWPATTGEAVTISTAQLGYLLEGIDWRLPQQEVHAVFPSPRLVPAKVKLFITWLQGQFGPQWWETVQG